MAKEKTNKKDNELKNDPKILYHFYEKDEREIEETQEKEVDGEKVTVSKKVKKSVPICISIKKPTRKQVEEADIQFAVKQSELVRRGMFTKGMLMKKYADTGGVLTESEILRLTQLYQKLADLQPQIVRYQLKSEKEITEEEKSSYEKITKELMDVRREIVEVETTYSTLFNHTADEKAKSHVIKWYMLMLTQIENENNEFIPFFLGETLEEKESYQDKLEEESANAFYYKVRQKLIYFLSYWYQGAIQTREDFVALEKDIEEGSI